MTYRIYYLGERGGIDFPDELSVNSDERAVEEARRRAFRKCEVWEGHRLVASLTSGGFGGTIGLI